jgi:hypothetical protein
MCIRNACAGVFDRWASIVERGERYMNIPGVQNIPGYHGALFQGTNNNIGFLLAALFLLNFILTGSRKIYLTGLITNPAFVVIPAETGVKIPLLPD